MYIYIYTFILEIGGKNIKDVFCVVKEWLEYEIGLLQSKRWKRHHAVNSCQADGLMLRIFITISMKMGIYEFNFGSELSEPSSKFDPTDSLTHCTEHVD